MAGPGMVALIDYCRSVDEKIAGRKLSQLKPVASVLREMPRIRHIGGNTYFASVVVLFYTLLISYICFAVTVRTLVGGCGVIAGFVLFTFLMVAMSGFTKGKTLSLKLFLAIWFVLTVCLILMTGWLLFAPFSWPDLLLWCACLVMLWLARRVMNGSELRKLMQWRVSLKAAQFRHQALTQPKRK